MQMLRLLCQMFLLELTMQTRTKFVFANFFYDSVFVIRDVAKYLKFGGAGARVGGFYLKFELQDLKCNNYNRALSD